MKLENNTLSKKINYWKKKIGVDKFKIDFVISEDSSPDDINTEADIEISLAYLNATITFYSPAIKESELDKVIVHELLHLILEPLSSILYQSMGKKYDKFVNDLIESTIEILSPIIIKAKR